MFIHSTHLINMTDTRSFLIFFWGVHSMVHIHISYNHIWCLYHIWYVFSSGCWRWIWRIWGNIPATTCSWDPPHLPPAEPGKGGNHRRFGRNWRKRRDTKCNEATLIPVTPEDLCLPCETSVVFTCSSEICQRLRCLFGREFVLFFSLWGWDIIENHGKNHQYEKLRSGSSDSSSFFWGERIISSPWPYCCVFFVPRSLKSNLGLGAHPLSGDLSCGTDSKLRLKPQHFAWLVSKAHRWRFWLCTVWRRTCPVWKNFGWLYQTSILAGPDRVHGPSRVSKTLGLWRFDCRRQQSQQALRN